MSKIHTMLAKLVVVCLSMAIFSSHANQVDGSSQARDTSGEVEQIQVEGKKTRLYYLYQMREAELDFYEAFNSLNDIESYRIICRLEKRTGSNMKYRVCYPQYLLQRWANETQDAMGGRNLGQLAQSAVVLPTLQDIEFLVERDKKKSLKHTEELVKKHPKLLEKLVSLEKKRLDYEKAKATM